MINIVEVCSVCYKSILTVTRGIIYIKDYEIKCVTLLNTFDVCY